MYSLLAILKNSDLKVWDGIPEMGDGYIFHQPVIVDGLIFSGFANPDDRHKLIYDIHRIYPTAQGHRLLSGTGF